MNLRNSSALLLLASALLLSGCARREFVLGLYDVPARALPKVASAGFGVVTIPAGERDRALFLEEARKSGVKVLAWPELGSRDGRERTARWDDHPALWGWYLSDEPDLNRVSPETVLQRRRALARIAQKRSFVVVASGPAVEKYRDGADLLAVDSYPISWAPLAVVSREMRTARLAAGGRTFYAVLQAFDWTAYASLIPGEGPQRPPTFEEMRCMAFLSLFHGAQGLFFYTHTAGDWNIEDRPAVWSALADTVAEVRQWQPVFEKRVAWWPAESRYDGAAPDMYNEIHEGRIALNLFQVPQPRGGVEAGYYVVAINTAPEPCAFSFKLPFRGIGSVAALSGAPAAVQDGWASKVFAPFEVCILGPVQLPLDLRRTP